MAYLEVHNVDKAYGSVIALRGVNMNVEKGEIRALLGGNGSGKSTLSKIIGGIVEKDTGEILINGNTIEVKSPRDAISKRIAVTSQELSLFPNLTVIENLSLINTPKKIRVVREEEEARSRAIKALERVGVTDLADLKVGSLPDSQKYLVELAKALLFEPEILIVDEITSALRREEVEYVGNIMKKLSGEGCIVLFISHRMNEIFEYCSSVTVLRNGELINTYNISDVDEETLLIDMIGENIVTEENNELKKKELEDNIIYKVNDVHINGFDGKPVSIELKAGQILGIAGLQGQGQSQLLRTLFGVKGPVTFEIDGQTKRITSPTQAIKSGVCFVSGDRVTEGAFIGRAINENLGVVNNLILNRKALRPDDTLKKYGVKYGQHKNPIESLSGGNQQKVIIARWTATEPKVLLADDPTKGIDVAARKDVHHILNDLAKNGSAVIFVSSDDEELVTLASRTNNYSVAVMYNGEFVKLLEGEDISTANIISASVPSRNGEKL